MKNESHIKSLCSSYRALTTEEFNTIRIYTNLIYKQFLCNKTLSHSTTVTMKKVLKKMGSTFFDIYEQSFLVFINKSQKMKNERNRQDFAYLSYRYVPNKNGIKIYHY